jgi:hypothetical protein
MSAVRGLPPLAFLILAGCVRTPAIETPQPQPPFDPLTFFAGASEGHAVLHKLFAKDATIKVESRGRIEGEDLVLDQTIAEPGETPRRRQWRIHANGVGTYAGTLSDAAGPVSGEAIGNRLHLAFPMKGGFPTQQWLTLAPDGRSAHNVLVVRKFGLTIAVLEEEIRKRD